MLTRGLGFSDQLLTSSRGLGFGNRLLMRVSIMSLRCINLAKKRLPAAVSRVAEQTRAWAGGAVIMGSNLA